jgi:HlyD family secretion protein
VHKSVRVIFVAAILSLIGGCGRGEDDRVQGYIEGEYVYISCPTPGRLERLLVQRGETVSEGQLLFEIESARERAERDAARRVAEAKARLEDARKGRRPSEIEALEAQLAQAAAAFELARIEKERQEALSQRSATSEIEVDRARTAYEQAQHRIAELKAELETARLGQREDAIAAAEANLRALEAALELAEWELSQKSQSAPQAGVVFDTLYRAGEWVDAGRPVVSLLPPGNIKARAFVPQDRVSRLKLGDSLEVHIDGRAELIRGTISFISPSVEFTPPVIYGRDSRSKLVFMIELTFDPQTAAELHPGQPLDVLLQP